MAGSQWVNCFLESLDETEVEKIYIKDSNETFKFGKGDSIHSSGKIVIPVEFGRQKVTIESDIVEADIPLLLSKEALKKAGTILDFNNDTAIMFGNQQTLIATESGHYAIPLSVAKENSAVSEQISVLVSTSQKVSDEDSIAPFKIAIKLHRQFCHCSAEKLIKLIKTSNNWNDDETADIIREVEEVTENCDICKKYKRSPPTPVVSCSMASHFNEVVAMDLIEVHGKYVLHLIDMFARYSAACARNTKGQEAITDAILKIWISYFGKPTKFLADNGGEFANETYTDMCTAYGIEIIKTSAESPWSNGLAERHNGVLKVSILKTIEDTKCTLDCAVAWSVTAKNTLSNNFGYSPNTIIFGKNPSFPSVVSDNIAGLTAENVSQIVEEKLQATRIARKAYIEAESSEKSKRALTHNIRTSCEVQYEQGDKVFFKRNDSKRWYGPGIVIGKDGKQVVVRNGSQTIRVHVSRLAHVGKELHKNDNAHCDNELNNEENNEGIVNKNAEDNSAIESVEEECDGSGIIGSEKLSTIETAISEESNGKTNTSINTSEQCDMEGKLATNVAEQKTLNPKVKTQIMYKLKNEEAWKKGFVHSRAGKNMTNMILILIFNLKVMINAMFMTSAVKSKNGNQYQMKS